MCDAVRDKVRAKLNAVLGDERMSKDLERCIYNWCIRSSRVDGIPRYWEDPAFRYRYTTKALSIHFNLTNPNNPGLLQKIMTKEMGLKKVVRASPAELFPELWEPVFERVAAKQLRKQLTIDVDTAPDGAFTCSKCKSKKTTFVELQTRSADEPMTLFIQCLNCQRRWKQ